MSEAIVVEDSSDASFNKATYDSTFSHVLALRLLLEIDGMAIHLLLNRSTVLMDYHTQIWQGKFYSNRKDYADSLGEMRVSMVFQEERAKAVLYTYSGTEMVEDDFFVKDLTEDQYFNLMGEADMCMKKVSRFYPTVWEIENFPNKLCPDATPFSQYDFSKTNNVRSLVARIFHQSTKRRKENEVLSEDAFKDFITEVSDKHTINYSETSKYLYNRHEFFANAVMAHNNLAFVKTDEKVFDRYGINLKDYTNKTPDVIYSHDDGIDYWIEFTVTDRNVVGAFSNKRNSYLTLSREVSRIKHKEIILVVVVLVAESCFDRRLRVESENRPEWLSLAEVDLSGLQELMRKVESIPNYAMTKRLVEMDLAHVNMSNIVQLKTELMTVLYAPPVAPKPKKSLSFDDAFSHKKPTRRSLKTAMEDRCMRDLLTPKTTVGYAARLLNSISEEHREGKYTKAVDRILKQTKASIATSVRDRIKDQVAIRDRLVTEGVFEQLVPKLFKIAKEPMSSTAAITVPSGWSLVNTLKDGTMVFRHPAGFNRLGSDVIENREGLGISETDMDLLRVVHEKMFEVEMIGGFVETYELCSISKHLRWCDKVALELSLLSERRWAMQKNHWSKMDDYESIALNGEFGVMKEYDFEGIKFAILVHKGTKITKEKQINYKIIFSSDSELDYTNPCFRSYRMTTKGLMESKWCTITALDLEHYVSVDSIYKTLLQDYEDKLSESLSWPVNEIYTKIPFFVAFPAFVLMEHKRPTETLLQLNRYLMHAFTGDFSDREGITSEIFKSPVRTLLQSAVIQFQCKWVYSMLDLDKTRLPSNMMLSNMMNSKNRYDKVFIPSFFGITDDELTPKGLSLPNAKKIEFSVVMNEIYLSNLMEKDLGFSGHRSKEILNKMAVMEKKFLKIKGTPWDKRELCSMDDTSHMFDETFMREATKFYVDNNLTLEQKTIAFEIAMARTVDEVAKMTKSILEAPTDYPEFVKMSEDLNVKKSTVFYALWQQLQDLPCILLYDMIKNDDVLVAVFGSFAKGQVGGAREILIQAIRTRLHTKFFNNFFEELCKFHKKEMITDDKSKRAIQTNTATAMRDRFLASMESNSDVLEIPGGINADASKWAQSNAVSMYIIMLEELKMPSYVMDELIVNARSYQSKLVFAPSVVVRKWKKACERDLNFKEKDPDTEWVRNNMDSVTGAIWFYSGMGQGNFQHPSSLYHCIVDDYSDYLMTLYLEAAFPGLKLEFNTMISSDDMTKMFLLKLPKKNAQWKDSITVLMMDLLTRFRILGNIHINWKKTAFQTFMFEFNSLFSIGKRVCLASLKSIYNAFSTVDLTIPERAVKEAISNLRRLLEDGCFLPTIKMAMKEMRKNIIKWYGYDETRLMTVTTLLDCDASLLPFHLGFLPLKHPLETLVFGPEIHIKDSDNSANLNLFYRNMYTADLSSKKADQTDLTFDEFLTGKIIFELPIRMDSEVKKMKDDFYTAINREKAAEDMETYAMATNMSKNDPVKLSIFMRSYLLKINRRYENSEMYRMNSLIRALQLSGSKIKVRGIESSEGLNYDLKSAIEHVLSLSSRKSCLHMYDSFDEIRKEAETTKSEMEAIVAQGNKSVIQRHSKVRELLFYNTRLTRYVSEREQLTTLLSEKPEISNAVSESLAEISNALGIELQDLFQDPLKQIRLIFSGSTKPFSSFKEFLNYHNKVMSTTTLSILCNFAPLVDRKANMLSLYMEKEDPIYVFTSKSMEQINNFEKAYVSLTSLGHFTKARELYQNYTEKRDICEIKINDTDVIAVAKIHHFCDKELFFNMMDIDSQKVWYSSKQRKNLKEMAWTNGTDLYELFEIRSKVFEMNFFTSLTDATKSPLWVYALREMNKLSAMNSLVSVNGVTKSVFKNSPVLMATKCLAPRQTARLKFQFTLLSNKVFIVVDDWEFPVANMPIQVYTDIEIDDMADDTLDILSFNELSLKELDQRVSKYFPAFYDEIQDGVTKESLMLTGKKSEAQSGVYMSYLTQAMTCPGTVQTAETLLSLKEQYLTVSNEIRGLATGFVGESTAESQVEALLLDSSKIESMNFFLNLSSCDPDAEASTAIQLETSTALIKERLMNALSVALWSECSMNPLALLEHTDDSDNVFCLIFSRLVEITQISYPTAMLCMSLIYKRYNLRLEIPSALRPVDLKLAKIDIMGEVMRRTLWPKKMMFTDLMALREALSKRSASRS